MTDNRALGAALLATLLLGAGMLGAATMTSAHQPTTDDSTEVGAENAERDEYGISVLRTWDQAELVVLVVPPTPYYEQGYGLFLNDPTLLQGTVNAVEEWERVIVDHGRSEISENVRFDVRVLGDDWVNPSELTEVDVVATSQGLTPIGGFATMEGEPCVMGNLPSARDPGYTYRIALHEFGHCLGLGHPWDFQPDEDVMIRCPKHQVLTPKITKRDALILPAL